MNANILNRCPTLSGFTFTSRKLFAAYYERILVLDHSTCTRRTTHQYARGDWLSLSTTWTDAVKNRPSTFSRRSSSTSKRATASLFSVWTLQRCGAPSQTSCRVAPRRRPLSTSRSSCKLQCVYRSPTVRRASSRSCWRKPSCHLRASPHSANYLNQTRERLRTSSIALRSGGNPM